MFSQIRAPRESICIETAGLPTWSKVCKASTTTPPLRGARLSRLDFNAYNSTTLPSAVGFPQAKRMYLYSEGNNLRTSG